MKAGNRRAMRLFSSVYAAAAVLCGAQAAEAAPKNFIYCTSNAPMGFDVALYSDLYTAEASSQMVYQRLVGFAPGGTNIVPQLAESWDISPDGKTYIFHLRKGVKFQTTPYFTPTRTLNADDVVFSIARQMDKSSPWHSYVTGQSYQFFDSMEMPSIIKSVRRLDDYTVEFQLNHPESPFLADMAMDFASVLSKEYADRLAAAGKKEQMNLLPLGTGPFIMVTNQKSVGVRYRANPDYWRGKPKLDNVIFAVVDDSSVRAQKLKAGECDLIHFPALNELAALKASPNIKVVDKPGLNLGFFAWNTTKAPFDKREVRRALNMAVDRNAIANIIFYNAVEMAKNPLPPAGWGYNNATPKPEYNPEKAKELLAQAGVKDLKFDIDVTASGVAVTNPKRLAEMLQSDWKKIGVNATINVVEWSELLRLSRDKERTGLTMMGWSGDNGDPDNYLGMLFSCASRATVNNSFFCSAEYDALATQAKQSIDMAERTKLYAKMQDILHQEQPLLLMAYSPLDSAAMRSNVTGFHLDPIGISFESVDKQ